MAQKIYPNARAALDGLLFDGMTIMSGGFGLSGNPESLIPEVLASGVKNLIRLLRLVAVEAWLQSIPR